MPPQVPAVTLRGGVSLPLCALGTWKSEKGAVAAAVEAALRAGYRAIDGAAAYGNEAEVGAGLAAAAAAGVCSRAQVALTSKLWHSKCLPAPGSGETTEQMVAAALDATLKDLGTDYVDL